MTCCAGVSRRKGHGHERQNKDDVVQETWKGQTFGRCQLKPECNSDIRDGGLRQQL
jgi:hypothetical protein